MKKKLLALVLVLTMVVGVLSACGSKKQVSYWDAAQELQEIKTGSFSMEMNIKSDLSEDITQTVGASLNDIYVKMDGVIESSVDPYKLSMNIQYKLAESDDYTKVTDVIFDEDALYINVTALREMLQGLNNAMISMYAGVLTSEEDYIKITMEDLEYLTSLSGESVDTSELVLTENTQKYSEILVDKLFTILEKSVEGVEPAITSEKKGTYSFKLNNENLVPFLTNLKTVIENDGQTLYNEYIDDISKLEGDNQEYIDALNEGKESLVPTLTESLSSAITEIQEAKDATYNLGYDFSIDGKEGKRIVEQSYTMDFSGVENQSGKITYKGNINEAVEKGSVKAPEASVTLTDFITNIFSSLGIN